MAYKNNLDSGLKYNSVLKEFLERCKEIKTLSRMMIEFIPNKACRNPLKGFPFAYQENHQ